MSFKKDLAYGLAAEMSFIAKYPGKLEKVEGTGTDLKLLKSGDGIQLKTDRRKSTDTGNMFLEKYSHVDRKTPGGPFRAEIDGSKYLIYYFQPSDDFTCYLVADLIKYLNENEKKLRTHKVWSSNAFGFIVPILNLKHLEIDFNGID